jgi:hypothetical protein
MNPYRRALTVSMLTATAFGVFAALGAPAVAMPMPWETGNVPASAPAATDGHVHTRSAQDGNPWHGLAPALPVPGETSTVTVLCGSPCYQ